jgi:hypothetical protein
VIDADFNPMRRSSMTPAVRRWFLPTTALTLAVLLLFHPQGEGRIYDGLNDDVTRWLVVHLGLAILAGAMGLAGYLLVDGLRGRAATVSRIALSVFVVFFIAWEATLGIGTGILVDLANGMPAADRAPLADVIEDYFASPILFVLSLIGNGAWVVAMLAAAVAFGRAGAGRAVTLLVACSSLFVMHDAGPVGAIGLACFAAAAVLVDRSRTRREAAAAARQAPADIVSVG